MPDIVETINSHRDFITKHFENLEKAKENFDTKEVEKALEVLEVNSKKIEMFLNMLGNSEENAEIHKDCNVFLIKCKKAIEDGKLWLKMQKDLKENQQKNEEVELLKAQENDEIQDIQENQKNETLEPKQEVFKENTNEVLSQNPTKDLLKQNLENDTQNISNPQNNDKKAFEERLTLALKDNSFWLEQIKLTLLITQQLSFSFEKLEKHYNEDLNEHLKIKEESKEFINEAKNEFFNVKNQVLNIQNELLTFKAFLESSKQDLESLSFDNQRYYEELKAKLETLCEDTNAKSAEILLFRQNILSAVEKLNEIKKTNDDLNAAINEAKELQKSLTSFENKLKSDFDKKAEEILKNSSQTILISSDLKQSLENDLNFAKEDLELYDSEFLALQNKKNQKEDELRSFFKMNYILDENEVQRNLEIDEKDLLEQEAILRRIELALKVSPDDLVLKNDKQQTLESIKSINSSIITNQEQLETIKSLKTQILALDEEIYLKIQQGREKQTNYGLAKKALEDVQIAPLGDIIKRINSHSPESEAFFKTQIRILENEDKNDKAELEKLEQKEQNLVLYGLSPEYEQKIELRIDNILATADNILPKKRQEFKDFELKEQNLQSEIQNLESQILQSQNENEKNQLELNIFDKKSYLNWVQIRKSEIQKLVFDVTDTKLYVFELDNNEIEISNQIFGKNEKNLTQEQILLQNEYINLENEAQQLQSQISSLNEKFEDTFELKKELFLKNKEIELLTKNENFVSPNGGIINGYTESHQELDFTKEFEENSKNKEKTLLELRKKFCEENVKAGKFFQDYFHLFYEKNIKIDADQDKLYTGLSTPEVEDVYNFAFDDLTFAILELEKFELKEAIGAKKEKILDNERQINQYKVYLG